jgi:trans-aconitate 2-methyltransferase
MADWSPATYLKFEDERTRPARDLLAQVPLPQIGKAIDMGCGPGNSTELIAARYPEAEIIGLDSSPSMLAEARARLPKLRFETADARSWCRRPMSISSSPMRSTNGCPTISASCRGSSRR